MIRQCGRGTEAEGLTRAKALGRTQLDRGAEMRPMAGVEWEGKWTGPGSSGPLGGV